MKIKTSEATNEQLDRLVAQIEGIALASHFGALSVPLNDSIGDFYAPTTDWAQGGPIIERESIDVLRDPNGTAGWGARVYISRRDVWCYGPTPLIAAMRCFCASKLGDEVEVPDELT